MKSANPGERRPRDVVAVLGRSPREWRAFFDTDDDSTGGNRARVRLWFSHFAHDGRHVRWGCTR